MSRSRTITVTFCWNYNLSVKFLLFEIFLGFFHFVHSLYRNGRYDGTANRLSHWCYFLSLHPWLMFTCVVKRWKYTLNIVLKIEIMLQIVLEVNLIKLKIVWIFFLFSFVKNKKILKGLKIRKILATHSPSISSINKVTKIYIYDMWMNSWICLRCQHY